MEEEKQVTTPYITKEHYPQLDKHQRKAVSVLQERHRYLGHKIDTGDCSTSALPFLRDERDALGWLLDEVEQTYGADGVDETAVRELEGLCRGSCDPEAAHAEADRILLTNVNERVRGAYEAVIERAPWWVAA